MSNRASDIGTNRVPDIALVPDKNDYPLTQQPKSPMVNILTDIQRYRTAILSAQTLLECVNLFLPLEQEVPKDQFDHATSILNMLHKHLQEISIELGRSHMFSAETSNMYYSLYVNLSYLEEQIPRLLLLVKTFRSLSFSSPRLAQRKRISKEIAYKLEAIVQSSREIIPTLTQLLNLSRSHEKSTYRLRLVYSSENVSEEEKDYDFNS